MKATELMIGDRVQSKDKNGEYFYTRIEVLDVRGKNKHIISSNRWIKEDDLEPIPLTAKILEKNGWRKYGLPYEWQKRIWVQRWHHNDIDISFDILETPKYDGFTWKGVEINEVHIIQHALRLCGLNDLADNFKV